MQLQNVPRTNRWVDGRNPTMWPIYDHIGWVVQTAGVVDLDLLPRSSSFNTTSKSVLMPKTKMILKAIDDGQAYAYDNNLGVLRLPVELLEPVGK